VLPCTVLIIMTLLLTGAEGPSAVTFVDHEKVAAAFSKGGSLARGSDFTASGARRTSAGQVEAHEKETDIIYVVDGEATFVTGGTMLGGKQTKAGRLLGTDVEGGTTHHLAKDDMVVVPAGTPHWFKEVPQSVSYFLVKVIKP